jgi:hypothetical protein
MKVRNNWVKITAEQGLLKLTKYQHDTYYDSEPRYIHLNLANVVFMENDGWKDNPTVTVAKGECHIVISLSEEAFKKFEELIFEQNT